MNKHQAATQTEATLKHSLAQLVIEEARAAEELQSAQELHRKASKALEATRTLYLLATIETGRLDALEQAELNPNDRDHYLKGAERLSRAYAILSAPAGPDVAFDIPA